MRRALVVILTIGSVACNQSSPGSGDQKQASAAQSGEQKSSDNKPGVATISRDAQEKTGMRTMQVRFESIPVRFVTSGQIGLNEEQTVHTGTYVDGRIVELKAKIGDYVHKGDILARLHSHSVHETRAALESANEEVNRQQETVEYRKRMSERMQRLLALKSASPQEVERAKTELASAQVDLQNARINVQKETVHLADLLRLPEADVKHLDETAEQAPIIAPIDGLVVDRKVTLGTIVEPGQEVFTISNLSSLWMTASVNEADISKLHIGSRAAVRTAAYPDEVFPGRTTYIGAELDPQTRTLPVRVLIPNPSRKLHPGMFANAEISEGSSKKSIFIPEEAIQDLSGGSVVFRRVGETSFAPRPVEIATRLNGRAEIRSGLQDGDVIVTRGSFVVKSQLLKSSIGE